MLIKNLGLLLCLATLSTATVSFSVDVTLRNNPRLKIREAMASPNWTCDYLRKSNLSHGSDGSVASTVITVAQVRCIGKNSEMGTYADFNVACLSPSRDSLPELRDCLDSASRDSKKFAWEVFPAEKTQRVDKYGRQCFYDTPENKGRMAFRLVADGSWDCVCTTPISCDNYNRGPKDWIAACPAKKIPGADGKLVEVCPAPHECVANELPLSTPHASTDFAILSKSLSVTPQEYVGSKKKAK